MIRWPVLLAFEDVGNTKNKSLFQIIKKGKITTCSGYQIHAGVLAGHLLKISGMVWMYEAQASFPPANAHYQRHD
jgi:hypothetical protein